MDDSPLFIDPSRNGSWLPPSRRLPRRRFLKGLAFGGASLLSPRLTDLDVLGASEEAPPEYRGPNVIIIRYGGGARRRESIDPEHTFSPFLCRELIRRGTLFKNMSISQFVPGSVLDSKGKRIEVETSHGQGTLYILTGKYERFQDVQYQRPEVERRLLGARFESSVPTLFEYLRRSYAIPEHQALIINGEDRSDEEFYNFSNHHLFGARYRSTTLSLRQFKAHVLRRRIGSGDWEGTELERKRGELSKLEDLDYRAVPSIPGPAIEMFWEEWRHYFGASGLVNPRGDRLLTELTLRALKQLHPKLLMVNYQDCDYVHWGYPSHYTRAIAVMDEGIQRIVEAVEAEESYRDNTHIVIVPDCGRDNNPLVAVPFQHHFNSQSAREIFALILGPGIGRQAVVDHPVDQCQIAATIGKFMGFTAEHADGPVLEEAFA
jgi:hypothetical protein